MEQPRKGSIYEVAKRYAACLYAMSDILGIEPYVMLTKHREVVSNVFQQASREGIRIAPDIRLPKLTHLIISEHSDELRRAS